MQQGKQYVNLRLTVGDPSGSHSERYTLEVGSLKHQAPSFGVVEEGVYPFEIGQTYEISIEHQGSNVSPPDYDYTASVEAAELADEWMVIVDDSNRILGNHFESVEFYAKDNVAL